MYQQKESGWLFGDQTDLDYFNELCGLFGSNGTKTCFAELESDFDERHRRNSTPPHRLAHKPSKRDFEINDNRFLSYGNNHRFNSLPGEITREKYIRINTTNLLPDKAAKMIKDAFNL